MKIVTEFVRPPIPLRGCDWCAIDEDTYDGAPDTKWPANCIGTGQTEAEAIIDLVEQIAPSISGCLARGIAYVRADGGCLFCDADQGESCRRQGEVTT